MAKIFIRKSSPYFFTYSVIYCNGKGEVIGVDLSNEGISGGINDSSTLFGLKNLESLNLAGNNFNFTPIPSKFGSLASLSYLNLSSSRFSGQIPGELSQLTRLEVLDLSQPFFFGLQTVKLEKPNLATLVQNLTRLRGLYLRNVNNLGAPVPDFFADIKNLTVLNLRSCNLSGTFPEEVFQLHKLQILDLSINRNLQGSFPDFPTNGSLQSLELSYTNFFGQIPESIGNLKDLSTIKLTRSNFSGKMPKSMENLTQLMYLDLSSNNFTGPIPSFQLCKNLTNIDLSNNSLSGTIPSGHFQDLQNLVLVDLRVNGFTGSIPSSLLSLQKVQKIQLSNNNFDGLLPHILNASLSSLDTLDLSSNKLRGPIPRSFLELPKLNILFLDSNNLSDTLRTIDLQDRWSNLTTLDLSFNNLSILTSDDISPVNFLPRLATLKLASCNLTKFPNLRNQSRLVNLDLSGNKIEGKIPSWLWGVGIGVLSYMNLSYNQLTSFEEPYHFPNINFLDLRSNRLSGSFPIPPQNVLFIDYSNNLFNSSLPAINLSYAYFFSISNNSLTGVIPETICNATNLMVLDLANNRLTGRIPRCLIEFGGNLGVLNLANNGLRGRIEGIFPSTCGLKTLDLQGNFLDGKIPQSLVNCKMLEVLNLGNNQINDTYPCFLVHNSNLRVLVLRSNRLNGSVNCAQNQQNKWSKLQILDIAHNNFSGAVPTDFFWQMGAMITDESGEQSSKHLSFAWLPLPGLYYQNSVTVTVKGLEWDLVKILNIFTSMDISTNQFSGEMPSTIGILQALYLLNVSHNMFTGLIPQSIGNLSKLESLDMSYNKLTGDIPHTLARLPFLSAFNLSYNQLEGRIPTGPQFQTFESNSYLGNKKLCGFPLSTNCTGSVVPVLPSAPSSDTSSNGYDWQSILHGMAVGAGSLTVIAVLYSLWKGKTSCTSRETNLS